MSRTATDQITRAKINLICNHPFFATLAQRMQYIEDRTIKTACTNGKYIKYNPDFILGLSLDEVQGLLAHEVMHPAMMHHTRRKNREPRRWNSACDYAINPLLEASKFKLPKGALINPAFANMSAEEIYNLLPPEDDGDGSGAGNDPGGCGAVEDAPGKSESEISQDEAEIKQVLAQAETIAKQQGKLPGHLERLIGEIMAPVVNWKEVLSRFLTETSKADYTFRKPSPRYMPMGLYLPSLESITSGKVVLLVDTSGSIGEEQLNRFAAEVYDILSAVNNEGFKVVYVDTKVAGVQDITEPGEKLEPQGGGGTDFRPGFQWIDDNEDQVSACIYLTDGYCSSFPKAPDYPTLWATIDNKNFAPPFGEVVSIDKNIE